MAGRYEGKALTRTYLVCPECGNTQSIQRRSNRRKRSGHIKTIYCYICRRRTDHVERREATYYD